MADQANDQTATNLAIATVAACIVQTIDETDSTFRQRFLTNLEKAYYRLRNSDMGHLGTIEILRNVRELVEK